jgi:hypothetical protein
MNDIEGIPYKEAEFNENGKLVGAAPQISPGATDIFVISHGWNNGHDEARTLYHGIFSNFKKVVPPQWANNRKLEIVGILWPSKAFDEMVAAEDAGDAAGGGAALHTGPAGPDPEGEKALLGKLDGMKSFFVTKQKEIDELKTLVPDLETKSAARIDFVTKVRALLDQSAANKEDASDAFFKADPEALMDQLRIDSEDLGEEIKPGAGGGAAISPTVSAAPTGGAASFTTFLNGIKTAAMNVLNYTTYYEMKERAGTVGKNGVAPLLDQVLSPMAQRIHLIGHSFGGRLVTSAAANSTTDRIKSMTLLQAAFSHNGFSQSMNGFFRGVVEKQRIKGPILVTFSKKDTAVGIAYPLASRLAGQVAAALGDAKDKYGGIGRNGAQQMNLGETIQGKLLPVPANLVPAPAEYAFAAGKFFNADGEKFIAGHSVITGPEVAYAIAVASLSGA